LNGGTITSLKYKANIVAGSGILDVANVPVDVWIGETTIQDLTKDWIDPAKLTLSIFRQYSFC